MAIVSSAVYSIIFIIVLSFLVGHLGVWLYFRESLMLWAAVFLY